MRPFRPRERTSPNRHGLPALRAILVALLGASAIALVYLASLGALSRADVVCTSCHAMRPYADATAATPHRLAGCVRCHSAAGAFGMLVDGLALQRRVQNAVLSRPVGSDAWTGDASCRSCHADVRKRMVVGDDDISVRHLDFYDVNCLECHAGTGHKLPKREYAAALMEDCTGCHRVSYLNDEACETCHASDWYAESSLTKTTWRVTHGPQWEDTHGMGDLTRCSMCHPQTYCVDCHGTVIPHAGDWPSRHGRGLGDSARSSCEKCHASSWCLDCHGIEMPHASWFLRDHSQIAEQSGDELCLRCHDSAGCDACHALAEHPDVPGVNRRHKR